MAKVLLGRFGAELEEQYKQVQKSRRSGIRLRTTSGFLHYIPYEHVLLPGCRAASKPLTERVCADTLVPFMVTAQPDIRIDGGS
jgi:hypothetical protein